MYHVSQRIVLFAVLYLRIFFDSVKETTGICIIFVSFYNILKRDHVTFDGVKKIRT